MNIKNTIRIIILIFLITFTMFTMPVLGENEASGFTVMSINSVPIISNNKDLEKANFTLTLVTGGGQSVVGNFGNETFSKILTNLFIKYPLKIEIGNIKESITYQILNEGKIYKYEYHYINAAGFFEGAQCDDSTFCFPIHTDDRSSFYTPDKILAVNRIPVGMYGSFGNPDISWNGNMTVTINGIPYTKSISSGDISGGSVNFYDITNNWVANAKWTGSLVTGQSTPNQNLYVSTYRIGNNIWQIAPKKYYDTYTKSLGEIDTTFNNWKESNYRKPSNLDNLNNYVCDDNICANVINYITNHNTILKELTDINVKISYGAFISTSSVITNRESDKLAGTVKDTINLKIGNPIIIMTVKAKALYPYISVGIPKIESITSQSFNSGDGNGVVNIKIKNVGDDTGTFSAYLTDESGTFTSQSNVESAKITLDKGETGTITMNINYGTNLQNITKTGIITVYDVNFPDEKTTSTKDFIINMKSPKVCQPNAYRIFNNEVYKCNIDGTDETLKLKCDNGLIKQVDGKYICEEIDGNTNSNFYEESESIISGKQDKEPKEKEQENSIFITALYWISGFIILTTIFIFVNKIRNDDEKITKQNIDKSILLSGILIGLLYLYIQYIILAEVLGLILWMIIIFIIILIGITNGISYIQYKKILPMKISIIIAICLFIIITALTTGMKELMCDNWTTSWMFSNCKEFSLTDYLFK